MFTYVDTCARDAAFRCAPVGRRRTASVGRSMSSTAITHPSPFARHARAHAVPHHRAEYQQPSSYPIQPSPSTHPPNEITYTLTHLDLSLSHSFSLPHRTQTQTGKIVLNGQQRLNGTNNKYRNINAYA